MTTRPTELPEYDTLLAATLFLMTRHAERDCPGLRHAIATHLGWLAGHPNPTLTAAQRGRYVAMAAQWAQMASGERSWNPTPRLGEAAPGRVLQ